jgi:CDP-diacylglycerol--glycerol-3-phosphate 3-phosphatidyltransferase
MIARSVIRCSATRRSLTCLKPRHIRAKQRRYSTTAQVHSPEGASQASVLGAFTNELDKIAPRFDLEGSQIQILRSPADFYNTLKVNAVD